MLCSFTAVLALDRDGREVLCDPALDPDRAAVADDAFVEVDLVREEVDFSQASGVFQRDESHDAVVLGPGTACCCNETGDGHAAVDESGQASGEDVFCVDKELGMKAERDAQIRQFGLEFLDTCELGAGLDRGLKVKEQGLMQVLHGILELSQHGRACDTEAIAGTH